MKIRENEMRHFEIVFLIIMGLIINNISAQTSFNISNKTTGDTLLTIDNEGRVGIGTTTPDASIDVKSSTVETASTMRLGNLDNSRYFGVYSGNATYSPLIYWHEGDALRFAAWADTYNEFMRLTASGRLGIGTTSPGAGIHLSGTGFPNSFMFLQAQVDGSAGFRLYEGSIPKWHIFNSYQLDGFQIYNNNGHQVFYADQSTGYVGIGTTAPSQKFEVADTIYSSIGGFKFPDGSVQISAAIGSGASSINDLSDGRTIGYSVFLGSGAGVNDDGSDNYNTAVGINALNTNTTGAGNVAIGSNALRLNTSGYLNTAQGNSALMANTTGYSNTAIGITSLTSNTTGNGNVAIGYGSGDALTEGDYNTFLGFFTDASSGNLNNATAIGANAVVDASNKVRIGNSNVTVIEGQVDFTYTSDKNKKENFLDINSEQILQKIKKFNLQSWNYKHDPQELRHYGPVAQEFFTAFGHDGVGRIGSDTTLTGSDVNGINMIAIQALEKRTTQLNEKINEISDLKKDNQQLKEEMFLLKSKIEKLESLFSKVEQLTKPKNNQYVKNENNSK